jgi:hypothetical protein
MADAGNDPDTVDEATRAADEGDAAASHTADRPPTEEEAEAAERAGETVPESVADAYQSAAETGARIEGEGQV